MIEQLCDDCKGSGYGKAEYGQEGVDDCFVPLCSSCGGSGNKRFDEKIWEEAKEIAKTYTVNVSRDRLSGFIGYCIEVPDITAESESMIECHILLEEAITRELASLRESNGLMHGIEELSGPKEIIITDVNQIINKMIHDGDLREHQFYISENCICCEGDDLGFYQQACEFLINERCKLIKELKNDRK